jgi:hypothetical protein
MAPKQPLSLDGLIQSKGAGRPEGMQQRGLAEKASTRAHSPESLRPANVAPEPRAKALTLRLTMTQYERLRRFAFDHNRTHQDVLEEALLHYLNSDPPQ